MAYDTPTLPQNAATKAETPFGESVGRYLLLAKLGRGGHGDVFAAYDPLLDRKVAVKLLHTRDGRPRPAILREARALARLSHPNVVTIHDVGLDDEPFLAMELLEGGDLSAWRSVARTPTERLATVLAVARGVAAAHAQGIVHGDIKPANILLAASGEVRVSDFGIARVLAGADDSHVDAGGPIGTPAYMSPEAADGRLIDERSDQFSFCVLAWEVLNGQHPRPVGTNPSQSSSKSRTLETDDGSESSVSLEGMSGRLASVLSKGLSERPEDRWPSMDALIAAIQDALPTRRRWFGPSAVIGVSVVGLVGWNASRVDPCHAAAEGGELHWTAARQAEIRDALRATDQPASERAWMLTKRTLDDYTETLASQRVETCRAARQNESPAVQQQRSCLERATYNVGAVTRRLSEADASVVHHAHALLTGLPSLDRCLEQEQLSLEAAPEEIADDVQAIRQQLIEARAESALGNTEQARSFLATASDAAALLDHAPLGVEVQLVEARLLRHEGKFEAAIELLDEALASSVAQRLWRSSFDAAAARSHASAQLGDAAAGKSHASITLGFARALGGDAKDLAVARTVSSSALEAGGEFEAAIAEGERALELQLLVSGENHVWTADVFENLSRSYRQAANLDQAEAHALRALKIRSAQLGEAHPLTARSQNAVARIALEAGRLEEAEQYLRDAERALVGALGEAHPESLVSKVDLASCLKGQKRYDEAKALLERVIELATSTEAFTQRVLVMAHGNLANVISEQSGDSEEVRGHYRKALSSLEALGLENSPHATALGGNLANSLLGAGEYDEALERATTVLEASEATLGVSHPDLAYALLTIGQVHEKRGDVDLAVTASERALAVRLDQPRTELIAEAQFQLARVLWEQGEETRALELAQQARSAYVDGGWTERATQVADWLAERPV